MRSGTAKTTVPAPVAGSGFGGAVSALRLGRAGVGALVLERVRRRDVVPDLFGLPLIGGPSPVSVEDAGGPGR